MNETDKQYFREFDKAELGVTLNEEGEVNATIKGSTNLLLNLLEIIVESLKTDANIPNLFIEKAIQHGLYGRDNSNNDITFDDILKEILNK